eukprot:g16279.t1
MLMVWMTVRNDWYAMYLKDVLGDDRSPKVRRNESAGSPLAGSGNESPTLDRTMPPPTRVWAENNGEIGWNDLLHVVMIPTYKTPMDCLRMALHALMKYSLCRTGVRDTVGLDEAVPAGMRQTNLAVCFAFEEREQDAHEKAEQIKQEYAGEFAFVTAAFHPPNLPGHRGFDPEDPRVVITVIDDDSELHENYFEGLTYHYLKASDEERYMTMFQPPITKLMTEGRARVKPIFLPLMNYAPEEDDAWSTVMPESLESPEALVKCWRSRWTQAKRHALGISEIVYVATKMYIGMCECGDFWRGATFVYRMLPLFGKFIAVHFVVGTLAFWPPLSHILINFYMWHSWCYIEDWLLKPGLTAQERIILNSWMVYFQERANACFGLGLVIAGSWGAFYFHLVADRVEGDWYGDWVVRNPIFLWIRTTLEVSVLGWFSSAAFGSVPEWVAAARIMFTLQFHHVVAGMVGRKEDARSLSMNPTTLPSHFGPGSQWGKPYYPMGQECEKVHVPRSRGTNPLSLSATANWQCVPNTRFERTMHVLHDPPSSRSCVVSHNPDGLFMDSQSHYTKVGSKHLCDPRPDHPHALARTISVPSMHPYNERLFYSSHLIQEPTVHRRNNFDWIRAKRKMK